jgi:hypothetical protein
MPMIAASSELVWVSSFRFPFNMAIFILPQNLSEKKPHYARLAVFFTISSTNTDQHPAGQWRLGPIALLGFRKAV